MLADSVAMQNLGINYGMTVPSIAKRLDRHPLAASNLLELHRRTYPRYWAWREQQADQAMLSRHMMSDDGWPLWITESPNRNTLYNYPMQSGGALMLRTAAVRLCEAGLVPSMLIHDGILFELDNQEQIEQAKAIMTAAGTEVCDGFKIDVDEEQRLEHGARYRNDKRPVACALWGTMMDVLADVGAIQKGAVA
jgi:DNA polymerase I